MPGWRDRGKGDPVSMTSDSDEHVDKITEVQMEIDASKHTVRRAIDKTIQRGDKLDDLEDKAEQMRDQGEMFHRRAVDVRKAMWWKNCKVKSLLAFAILVALLIIYFAAIHPFVKDMGSDSSDGESTAAPHEEPGMSPAPAP